MAGLGHHPQQGADGSIAVQGPVLPTICADDNGLAGHGGTEGDSVDFILEGGDAARPGRGCSGPRAERRTSVPLSNGCRARGDRRRDGGHLRGSSAVLGGRDGAPSSCRSLASCPGIRSCNPSWKRVVPENFWYPLSAMEAARLEILVRTVARASADRSGRWAHVMIDVQGVAHFEDEDWIDLNEVIEDVEASDRVTFGEQLPDLATARGLIVAERSHWRAIERLGIASPRGLARMTPFRVERLPGVRRKVSPCGRHNRGRYTPVGSRRWCRRNRLCRSRMLAPRASLDESTQSGMRSGRAARAEPGSHWVVQVKLGASRAHSGDHQSSRAWCSCRGCRTSCGCGFGGRPRRACSPDGTQILHEFADRARAPPSLDRTRPGSVPAGTALRLALVMAATVSRRQARVDREQVLVLDAVAFAQDLTPALSRRRLAGHESQSVRRVRRVVIGGEPRHDEVGGLAWLGSALRGVRDALAVEQGSEVVLQALTSDGTSSTAACSGRRPSPPSGRPLTPGVGPGCRTGFDARSRSRCPTRPPCRGTALHRDRVCRERPERPAGRALAMATVLGMTPARTARSMSSFARAM